MGFIVAAILLLQRDPNGNHPAPQFESGTPDKKTTDQSRSDNTWRLLLTAPILINLVFFMLMAMTNFGLQQFSVVALGALYGTSAVTANAGLTSMLVLAAIGVLAGGWVASRTKRHDSVAMIGMVSIFTVCLLLAWIDLPAAALILAMSIAGFASGAILPSRDMIVRSVTPAGSYGKVFGFVTNGFNVAGIITPLVCGALMDHGAPRLVFLVLACFALTAVAVVALMSRIRAAA